MTKKWAWSKMGVVTFSQMATNQTLLQITPPTLRYKLTANVNGNTYSAEISITRNHDFEKIGENSKSRKKFKSIFFENFLKISSLCVLNDADHFKPKKHFSIFGQLYLYAKILSSGLKLKHTRCVFDRRVVCVRSRSPRV